MKRIFTKAILLITILTQTVELYAQASKESLSDRLEDIIKERIKEREFPGAQVIAIKNGEVILNKTYGHTDYSYAHKVTDTTMYDLASLTKCMATTISLMYLYDHSNVDLNAPIKKYLPKYDSVLFGSLPLTRFLTHTTGFISSLTPQYKLVYAKGEGSDSTNWFNGILSNKKNDYYPTLFGRSAGSRLYIYHNIQYSDYVSTSKDDRHSVQVSSSLFINPEFYNIIDSLILNTAYRYNDNKTRYSDINFHLLKNVVESISSQKIDIFLKKNIYSPLNLKYTSYLPLASGYCRESIAPTEYDYILRKEIVWGYCHDEFGAIMGNVEGNAGLFSTAKDLLVICKELMNPKDGFFKASTKQKFTSQPYIKEENYRALGFQRQNDHKYLSDTSFGHSGFTGTFFQIDTTTQTLLIFLSNKINPSRSYLRPGSDIVYNVLWEELIKK